MESDYWEPKSVEAFAPIRKADKTDSQWLNQILNSVGEPLELNKFRERVELVLEDAGKVSLTEMVNKYPLERGVVDVVCYRVVAGEDDRHNILEDEIIKIDLNRPAQPRFVEVEQLIFQKESL